MTILLLAGAVVLRICMLCAGASGCPSSKFDYSKEMSGEGVGEGINVFTYYLERFRDSATVQIQKYLPSPHSDLLLGMVVGINSLNKVPRFNDVLKSTGTIHVVVVSGYNISLVFGLVIGIVGSQYKIKSLISALVVTLIYAVISGFEPPVIRAWIMGTIAAFGRYYGRSIDAQKILIFSALVMVLINPDFIVSLSFQLSFAATFSLIYYGDVVSYIIQKLVTVFRKNKDIVGKNVAILGDLSATLSAQVLVLPIISYSFGRVSSISPLVNCLILWTVPISTVMGGLLLLLTYVSPLLAKIFAPLVYVFLDVFARVVYFFGNLKYSSINLKISWEVFVIYYVVVLLIPKLVKVKK